MAGRYAKPDAERLGHRPAIGKGRVELPAGGRKGKPPALPKWRLWHAQTVVEWARLWATPQATQWAQDGSTLFVWACLLDDLVTGKADAAKVSSEMRQHADRHGMSPKALEQLGWRIVDETAPSGPSASPVLPPKKGRKRAAPATVTPLDERRARVAKGLGVKA